MARKPVTDLSAWPSLTLEGNLIAPAMVAKIAAPKDDEETRQSYRIRKGLSIRDEISTAFRVGQSHFDAFRKHEKPSAEATRRFMRDFLAETLGFDDLTPHEGAVCLLAGGRVPIVVTPPDEEKLDRKSATLSTDRSRSAAFALQDYVNEQDDALWGLATNGTVLRLMRDNASLTRPAYIEADLSQIFTNEDAASFSILWLLFHRTRFGNEGAPATDCDLERWRDAGAKEGEASRDRLAGQVQLALKLLGSGFLEANPDLSKRLQSGDIPLTGWFNELLRLVYRLIFLMVAEDRNLLHPPKAPAAARKLYAEGYSLSALRALCTRGATWDRHHDRYEGIKILFRSLSSGEDALALPALGGLFAADQLPHLGTARLRNRAFMEALYRLSWLTDEKKTGMVPVNWRAMETEELGSVYESLLELQPQLGSDERSLLFASDAAEQRGNQRKLTGSFYTPDPLVQSLLDTALDPVLDRIEAESDDPAKALLKLRIIDPACGSGHFLLAAARRIATRLARIRAEGTPSTEDFRHALRDVARCCIHGVDRNPMAVELTKVALWIETVDPGLPLGFFDAQIRCGDALLGVFDLKVLQDGIPDAAYKPLTGDDKDTAKYYAQANKGAKAGQGEFDFGTGKAQMPDTKPLAADFSGFRDLPEETVEQIGAKAKRFETLRRGQGFLRTQTACDLYMAAFLLPKTGGAPTDPSQRSVPTTGELWLALNQGKIRPAMEAAPDAARRARVFHWPLEFPDVMQRGGFDVVLGNPPWGASSSEEASHYYKTKFSEIIVRMVDSFIFFTSLGFEAVCDKGRLGFVLPDAALYQTDTEKLRRLILTQGEVCLVVNAGSVFEGVARPAALLVASRTKIGRPVKMIDWTKSQTELDGFTITQEQLSNYPGTVFAVTSPPCYSILEKVLSRPHVSLEETIDGDGIQRGVSPDLKEAFIVTPVTVEQYSIEKSHLRSVFTGGRDVRRFSAKPSKNLLIYTNRNDDFSLLPGICNYIDTLSEQITCSEVRDGKHPIYALHRPRESSLFLKSTKIVGVITSDRIIVAVDEGKHFATDAVYLLSPKKTFDAYFLTGLLNSKLFSFLYSLYSPEGGRVFAQVKPTVLRALPVPVLTKSNQVLFSKIAEISLAQHKCSTEITEADDEAIDSLVYELFEVSQSERAFIDHHVAK